MKRNPVVRKRIREIIDELRKDSLKREEESQHYLKDINGIRANLRSKLSMKRMLYFIAVRPVIWEQSNRTKLKDKATALDYLETFKQYQRARAEDESEHQEKLAGLRGRQHTREENAKVWSCMQRDIATYIVNLYEVKSNTDSDNWFSD